MQRPVATVLSVGALCVASLVASANPLEFPTYVQHLTVAYASAADAAQAKAEPAPLPKGASIAFTTRWDDSTPAHAKKAGMLEGVGFKATFFLNGDENYLASVAPKLLKGGHALGNHTSSHPFMMETDVNRMQLEVVRNRMAIEAVTDTTVVSFAMPYNWNSPVDENRPALLGKILVDTGHYVSGDWFRHVDRTRQPASAWMPAFTFVSNDSRPDPALFRKNFEEAAAAARATAGYPRVNFGIHSWCDEQGQAVQAACLKPIADDPQFVRLNDNEYGAARYAFFHGAIRPVKTRGKTVVYELTRFYPSALGSDIPWTIRFTGATPASVALEGRPLAAVGDGLFEIPHASAAGGLPVSVDRTKEDGSLAKNPGLAFTIAPDEANGTLTLKLVNGSEVALKDIYGVVYPAPPWSRGRIVFKERELPPGATLERSFKLGGRNDDVTYWSSDTFYAAQIDFTDAAMKRRRLWASREIAHRPARDASAPLLARDASLTMGPFPVEMFDEASIVAASDPSATLAHLGRRAYESWLPQANGNGAPWSLCRFIPWQTDRKLLESIRPFLSRKGGNMRLVAFDFVAPKAGPVKLRSSIGRWVPHAYYLNGEKFSVKGGHQTLAAREGRNRLILQAPLPNAHHASTFAAAVFSEDGALLPCFKPPVGDRP